MDITFRLNRLILGESMLVPRSIAKKTERLEVVKPRKVQIREARELRKHGTKKTRKLVEAGPNAPKLIRLIRHPYAETVTTPKRGEPWRQPLEERVTPEPFGTAVRNALHDSRLPRWPRATRDSAGLPQRIRVSTISFVDVEVG